MDNRIFNLEDFPDGIYVEITNKFGRKLKDLIKEKYGTFRKVSKILKIPEGRLNHWLRGERTFNLKMLLKLKSILDLNTIERKITAYKLARGKKVMKPNLPLKEDERMFNIIIHLMGDGYVRKGQMSEYYNDNDMVREDFKRALEIFGDVQITEKGHSIYIPTVIITIIKHLYHVKFGSLNCRLPHCLWISPRSYVAEAIKVLGDDEGTVGDGFIRFALANKEMLKDVRNLLIERLSGRNLKNGIPTSSVSKIKKSFKMYKGTRRTLYYFNITSKGFEKYKELIAFSHSEKIIDLDAEIRRIKTSKKYRNRGVSRKIVLDVLSKGPKTAKELARTTNMRISNMITYHLKRLEKEGIIKIVGHTSTRAKLWALC